MAEQGAHVYAEPLALRCQYTGCGSGATVQIKNGFNAVVGRYCRRCADCIVKRHKREDADCWCMARREAVDD